ncbi:YbbR-like domain-containing protein [Candidatus Fermentibacteria bacterium]|nr:YbbR-like domain-containing protein [Candidatus Fermentibacteria bacterium]
MSRSARLRGLLFHNLTLKISSLALATLLWLHASTLHTYEDVLSVRLTVSGIPDSMVTLTPVPERARVAFRGKGDQLWWLSLRQPQVVVSLDEPRQGVTMVPLYPANVRVPGGLDVQVTDVVSPRSLRVELDVLTRKTVPVVVETAGLPAAGYVRVSDEIEVEPPHVTLEGPSSVIDDLDRVRSEPLDVANAKGLVARKVRLLLPPAPLLSASVEAVTARVQFERLARHTLVAQPEANREVPEGWVLQPAEVRLHLWAPGSLEDSLHSLTPEQLGVSVTIPRTPRDSTVLDIAVQPPGWIRQCTVDPPRVVLQRSPPGS